MNDARRLALEALRRIERDGAYANIVTPHLLGESTLSPEDRRFVTELVYGTTRLARACDASIDRFVTSPPDLETRLVLRLAAYQLHYAAVPPHAAVDTAVALAPRRTKGFVNAVLRKVATVPMVWPDEATRLSCPDWILDTLRREVGADAVPMLEHMNTAPRVTTRDDGYVQDLASQWVADAVGAREGEWVLDVCAGPGGKATALARHGARVIGADRQFHRAALVRRNAANLGCSVPVVVADAAGPPFAAGRFDRVLVDAPCSGLGALRRRPDARWRIRPSDVDDLAELQSRILTATAPLVRVGGVLVYSVCTVTARESIDHAVPSGFEPIARHDDDLPTLGPEWREFGIGFRVLPHEHDTDGMVVVRYRRRS